MSIYDDMKAIGALIGRDLDVDMRNLTMDNVAAMAGLPPVQPYAPNGRCETCGTELEYEPPFHGAPDQPPSTGGFWCTGCEEWV